MIHFGGRSLRFFRLLRSPRFFIGFMILTIIAIVAIFAPYISPYELGSGDFTKRLCEPSSSHLLGCDINGDDIVSILIWGSRTSLYVGILTVLLAMTVGVSVGLIAGFYRGTIDTVLMRIVDIFMAFPGILLAMALTALLGPSLNTIIFAIAATGWTSAARLVRGQVLSIRSRDFVVASAAFGASPARQMLRHILPHTVTPLLVHGSFTLSGVIIVEAGLSFLGLGAQDAAQTWGSLLSQASELDLWSSLHVSLAPGFAIFSLVMALNFIGDSLRDAFDPKFQKR